VRAQRRRSSRGLPTRPPALQLNAPPCLTHERRRIERGEGENDTWKLATARTGAEEATAACTRCGYLRRSQQASMPG
jgi:hypothetical protein